MIQSIHSDTLPEVTRVHLDVGAAHVALEPSVVWTVLGSCVAVILHVPQRQITAVCHAQMPDRGRPSTSCRQSCAHPCLREAHGGNGLTFVTCSIEFMLQSLSSLGVNQHQIVAALVGGARVLRTVSQAPSIGEQNVAAAREMLLRYDIQCRHEDVGGSHGRTLHCVSNTGQIHVRHHRTPEHLSQRTGQ